MIEQEKSDRLTLPSQALEYGYAGLIPQILAVLLVAGGHEWQWIALAAGWAYAALIFSFIGGIWWGLAIACPTLDRRLYLLAIAPSLIALASFIPWTVGWDWPRPSLITLGILIAASPVVDYWISRQIILPDGWLKLRWHLALGLGGLTGIMAMVAPE